MPGAAQPQSAIIGSWRPTSIPGYTPPAGYPNAFADAPISFDGRHRLSGTDGCNRFDVADQVGRDGSTSVGEGVETLIGCGNVPNDVVTGKARRFTIDRDRLTLLDA